MKGIFLMKEFFGFGGYQRAAEGFMSWQHLVFVTSLVILMVVLAVLVVVWITEELEILTPAWQTRLDTALSACHCEEQSDVAISISICYKKNISEIVHLQPENMGVISRGDA